MDPADLKYAKTHEWVHVEGDVATVGISDFAVKALTDLVYIGLPETGKTVVAGETFGEVESVKAVSDLYAPVSGEVIGVNDSLSDDLDALSDDPYGRGWMLKIRVSDASALDSLMNRKQYESHCESAAH
jgi:glycine cleavage system H protein